MKNNKLKILTNGIIKENPILVLILGTCPFLAVTTQASNAIGMGAAVTFVLLCSNMMISLLRKVISDKVRIPCYIVVIASFVTLVQMIVKAFVPALDAALGLYLPLIVVNCIILARAESFASKSKPLAAAVDGICQGIGYTLVLLVMSAIRELLGSGTLNGVEIFPSEYAAQMMALPVGGFLTLGALIALMQWARSKTGKGGK